MKQSTVSRVYQYTHWVYTQKLGLLGHMVVLQTDFVFIELGFISLCRFFFFQQIEGFWQPCIEQIYWYHFFNSICLLPLLMSHFW